VFDPSGKPAIGSGGGEMRLQRIPAHHLQGTRDDTSRAFQTGGARAAVRGPGAFAWRAKFGPHPTHFGKSL